MNMALYIIKSFNISDPTFDVVRVVVCLKAAGAKVTRSCDLSIDSSLDLVLLRIPGSLMQQGVYSGRAPPDFDLTPSRASGVTVIQISKNNLYVFFRISDISKCTNESY